MAIKCFFGSHEWNGCKCKNCRKTRNEQHEWDGCKCKRCSGTRDERDEQHDWEICTCKRCGKIRDGHHEWDGCKCKHCTKENHKWVEKEEEDHIGSIIVTYCEKCGEEKSSK